MVISGSVEINGTILNKRDALGAWDTEAVKINPQVIRIADCRSSYDLIVVVSMI
jgi:hypothetical protein